MSDRPRKGDILVVLRNGDGEVRIHLIRELITPEYHRVVEELGLIASEKFDAVRKKNQVRDRRHAAKHPRDKKGCAACVRRAALKHWREIGTRPVTPKAPGGGPK